MPIRPSVYEPQSDSNVSGTGIGSGRVFGGRLTAVIDDKVGIHRMGSSGPLRNVAELFEGFARRSAQAEKLEAQRQAAELDTKLLVGVSDGIKALDDVSRALKQGGVGAGPGESSRYAERWQADAQKVLETIQGNLPDVIQQEFTKRIATHVVQGTLGARTYGDNLFAADEARTGLGLTEQAYTMAGNLALPEAPSIEGDKRWAFAGVDEAIAHVNQRERIGLLNAKDAEIARQTVLKGAIDRRALAYVHERPEVFLARSYDEKDIFGGRMDPARKIELQGQAERRYLTLVGDRNKLREEERKAVKQRQELIGQSFKNAVDEAVLKGQSLTGFRQQLLDQRAHLGPESDEFQKATSHLLTAENAQAERGRAPKISKEDSALAKNTWQTRIYRQRGEVDVTALRRDVIEGRLLPDHLDDLTSLAHKQREDVRKDWHRVEFDRLQGELGSPKLPGYMAKLGQDKLSAVSTAAEYELHGWIEANPSHDRSKLSAAATEIISRYGKVMDKYADNPVELLGALPKNPTTGKPYQTEDEVLKSTLPRELKDAYVGVFGWVESRRGAKSGPKMAPGASGAQGGGDAPQQEQEPTRKNPSLYRKAR